MSVCQERSPVLGLTMREIHEARHGDRSPGGHNRRSPMKSPSKPSSSSVNQLPTTSSHSHHHTHAMFQRRQSKASKSETPPMASPRPPSKPSPRQAQSSHRAQEQGYFFGIDSEQTVDALESSGFPKHESSPSSSIKSFAAALPKNISLDANPDFEAFKRQADINRGKSFALSTPNAVPARPRPPRWNTHANDSGSGYFFQSGLSIERSAGEMDIDQDSQHDSTYVSSESKRNSESSLLPKQLNMPRYDSPKTFEPMDRRTQLTKSEDRDPRLSIMEHRVEPPSPKLGQVSRATTLPSLMDEVDQPAMIRPSRLRELMQTFSNDQLMLLDIRSASNYAQSRVKGALNLCIPTTLLKRATFNTAKLQQTFQRNNDSEKFAQWPKMQCIVVYDAHSSEKKDAITAQNMTKKFVAEGFKGNLCILQGGFSALREHYPNLVDDASIIESPGADKSHSSKGSLAPVIGGVRMPTAQDGSNPFFSNIRQNMDLADGVGQLKINTPYGLNSHGLPHWLKEASADKDQGKQVSEKFLNIEREEQTRMRQAYAAFNPNNPPPKNQAQLCGVEKGVKNRYKDILPFEHARVKLQDIPEQECDYINASHIQASRSKKKYIATQGPLPATFEDFWSVVWEQDVRVVVMLTAETEGGQLKCHPYWKGRDFGKIKLKLISEKKASLDIDKHRSSSTSNPINGVGEHSRQRAKTLTGLETNEPSPSASSHSDSPFVYIRKFALSHSLHPFEQIREITHLHFPSWPDFGTPAQPSHLLALIELANIMQRAALPLKTSAVVESRSRSNSLEAYPATMHDEPEGDENARPMLVHCSAGCGRTGTFCTVDSVIDMLKRQKREGAGALGRADSEGDTVMFDEEPISPRTTQEPQFKLSLNPDAKRRKSVGRQHFTSCSRFDTSWVSEDGVDLIQKTVEDFREQRLSMVQSLRQYVLCYETVLEWIHRMRESSSNELISSR